MTLEEVIQYIDLPAPLAKMVCANAHQVLATTSWATITQLCDQEHWREAERVCSHRYKDDNGIGILTCMLLAATHSYDLYQTKQIPDPIFIDTMKCFSRFVREYQVYTAEYGFDRSFWCGRQLSLQLFRIDALEFELCNQHGHPYVAIHIPSDASMTPEACKASIAHANRFFTTYFPAYANATMSCTSWLLSPALSKLLPHTSNIRQFQSLFQVDHWNQESKDYLQWVFQTTPNCPLATLPEKTTLQRNMKAYLVQGGHIGSAHGTLISYKN